MLRINDGSFDIVTGGGADSSTGSKTDTTGDTSNKGLKSYVELIIAGGEYSMDTCDDAGYCLLRSQQQRFAMHRNRMKCDFAPQNSGFRCIYVPEHLAG